MDEKALWLDQGRASPLSTEHMPPSSCPFILEINSSQTMFPVREIWIWLLSLSA
jgi:DNA polymerase III delta prime subunit